CVCLCKCVCVCLCVHVCAVGGRQLSMCVCVCVHMLWGWMRFQANGIISTYPGLRWVHLALGWRAGSDGCGECGANGLVSPKSWFHTGQYSVRGVVLDPGE